MSPRPALAAAVDALATAGRGWQCLPMEDDQMPPPQPVPATRLGPGQWYEIPVRVFAPGGDLARAVVQRALYPETLSGAIRGLGVGVATAVPAPPRAKQEPTT